jgi:hypothetical protein
MKFQLQLDLGEIRWAARNYLEGSLPCRYCQDDSEEARTRCECPPGSVFFPVLPLQFPFEEDELAEEAFPDLS